MKKAFLTIFMFLQFINFYAQNNIRIIDSLKISLKEKNDTTLIQTLEEISWQYKAINIDSALKYSKRSVLMAKNLKHDKLTALVYNTLATVYEGKSELDSALIFHKESLTLKVKNNDSIGIANTYNNFGIIYDKKGEYLKSLKNYFKALDIYEKSNATYDRLCLVYVNIGIVYKKQKEYQKSLNFYHKAIESYTKNENKVGEIITISNISSIYLELKDYYKAIEYSSKAASGFKSLGYLRYVPYMTHNIAIAKTGLKKYNEAIILFLDIIKKFQKENNLFELADAKINLADTFYQKNEFLKCLLQLKEALKIIKENDYKEKELRALLKLSKVSFKQNRFKEAFKYLKEYDNKKDSVFEKNKTKSILELETKYQSEKKEKELLRTRTEKAETELKLSKTKYWIYILVGVFVLAVLLFFAINQRNKRKNQEEILEQKEQGFKAIIEAQEEERSKIARELHDGVVQQIGSVILKSRNLFSKKNLIDEKEPQELLESLENSNQELRNISHQMMPRALKELGIIPALQDLLDGSLSLVNIKYSLEHFNIEKRLPQKIEVTIYRITQELINNIIKHSKANEVSVQLYNTNNTVILIVEDNGVGFSSQKNKKGIGLLNISSRLDLVKGDVNFEPSPKSGTLVTIKIPL
ncbi:tetratricopeptide repeat-containing sensor histidine kinase [Polaribacter sp.]|uniref:tetratricopeptide repeat-containing sensor histidine kinase n=1 Tax=Polaribacter sp. TaxID=1920175 RepID=UPI003EF67B15